MANGALLLLWEQENSDERGKARREVHVHQRPSRLASLRMPLFPLLFSSFMECVELPQCFFFFF